jgi:small basic protein
MGWFLALVAGVLGFIATYYPKFHVDIIYSPYISVAAVAGIDSLIGGMRAAQEGKFQGSVFVSGFVVNTLLAAFLAFLGEHLGQPLALAAVIVLTARIFVNLSIIRREWMDKVSEQASTRRSGGSVQTS